MKILEILNSPWAITPAMYQEIREVYITHLKGEKIDLKEVEARIGKPLDKPEQGYDVINGSAIIPIEGTIARRMNMFSRISGGASTELIARDFKAALADPSVKQIILNIDSPGGSIDGLQELATLIRDSRGQKPIYSITGGTMASAAYWIGSSADKVFIASDTTRTGSIGVVMSHLDVSKAEDRLGYKTTEIYSGKFKRIASEYKPLSEDGLAYLQSMTDYLYSVFIGEVSANRGISIDDALKMADGKIFIGKQAIEVGLVDGVSTLEDLINNAGGVPANARKEAKITMTKEELKAKHPELYDAIVLEGFEKAKAELGEASVEAVSKAKTEGAEVERARIQDVKSMLIPGHEALVETLMFDGKSTGADAAKAILVEEKKQKTGNLEKFRADNGKAKDVKNTAATDTGEEKDFGALVAAYIEEHKCSRGKATEAVAKLHPEEHEAWLKKINKKEAK